VCRIHLAEIRMFASRQCRSLPSRFVYSNNELTNHGFTERQSHMNTIIHRAAIAVRCLASAPGKLRKAMALTLTATVALGWFASSSTAQPGALDTNFGLNPSTAPGKGAPIASQFDYFRVLDGMVLPDDRIVVGGACPSLATTPAGTRFCIAVWRSDGISAQMYLGPPGMTRVRGDALGAIARQPDGKIVLAAPCTWITASTSTLCAVRFNTDFSVDTTFAISLQFPGLSNVALQSWTDRDAFANALAIQPDGKIIVAGQCPNGGFGSTGFVMCIHRFLSDGYTDNAFGNSGERSFEGLIATPTDRIKDIAVATDGRIILGGECQNTNFLYPCAARLSAAGAIDTGFSSGTQKPKLLAGIGAGNDFINAMTVQANGEFIFAGHCNNASSVVRVPCALRVGAPNATQFTTGTNFSGATVPIVNGLLREPAAAGHFEIIRVALQPDGKILALLRDGTAEGSLNNRAYTVRRYNEDGSADANWTQTPIVFPNTLTGAVAIGQQSNGKVVVMGYRSINADTGVPEVYRLDNRPSPGRNCGADIDGDGKVLPTTDGLLLARASLGMTGNAVVVGAVGAGARRGTWTEIRDFLIMQCGMQTIVP
jgi:uncharacterized delta-60 repeat protein